MEQGCGSGLVFLPGSRSDFRGKKSYPEHFRKSLRKRPDPIYSLPNNFFRNELQVPFLPYFTLHICISIISINHNWNYLKTSKKVIICVEKVIYIALGTNVVNFFAGIRICLKPSPASGGSSIEMIGIQIRIQNL